MAKHKLNLILYSTLTREVGQVNFKLQLMRQYITSSM